MGMGSGFDAGVRQLNDPYRCRDLDDPERITNRDNSLWKRGGLGPQPWHYDNEVSMC